MMMAFVWTGGVGADREGRKELSCHLLHICLSLILLVFCETYMSLILGVTSVTDT